MANAYYDYTTGLVGNSGLTALLPKATRDQAVAVAGAGDKVIALAGNQQHESSHFIFDDARIEESAAFRTAILRPAAAELTYAGRTSSGLTAANNPHKTVNLTFDGSTGNSGAGTTRAFEIAQDAAEDLTIQQHGCQYYGSTTYGLLISMRRGRVELVNCKSSGSPITGLLVSTASLSGDGNQVIDIQGFELSGSGSSGSVIGVDLAKINNTTNTLDLAIKGVHGTLTATGTASVVGMNIKARTPSITNFDLTVRSTSTGTGHFGVLCQGQTVATATLPIIANGTIDFDCDAGYAIALGQSTVDAYVTGGEVSGNGVIGRYFANKTPHGFMMGQAVAGATMRGNVARDIYVGYLASKCTSGTIEGNVAFDCYGTSFYVKGTTAITIQDNVAIVSGKFALPTDKRGVLSVAPQGVTNTAAATIQRNLVIVSDVSKINSLAYIEDASQVCSFDNNTYVIPDTVDVTTALLFTYENGAGGAANQTLAQWNANTEVGTDKIIQLPASEIANMINQYRQSSGSTGGLVI